MTKEALRNDVNSKLQRLIDISAVLRGRYDADQDVTDLAVATHEFYQSVLAERAEADQ